MGGRLYGLLMRLMPGDFRREFGDEMCRVADEQWAEHRAAAGVGSAVAFWMRQYGALLRAGAGLHHRTREQRGRMTMEGFGQDIRHAVRALTRRPGFTFVTVVTLGLGIGATTAIFSAVNTVLLRALPYADAAEVVVLFRTDGPSGERHDGVSAANIRDFRDAATLFDEVAVAEPWSLDLQVDGRAESLRTWSVTRGFFEAIGTQPVLGRTFSTDDYDQEAAVVVMSHGAWVDRFGADPDIVGQSLLLDGSALTVVGVMPAEFRFPDASEMWIPRPVQTWDESSRPASFMTGVARLADGASPAQARAETDRIATTLREAHPRVNADLAYDLVPLRDHLFGDIRTPLIVIMAAVAFVLLIACANVAGLMLARGAQRERDYALRGALGAGTGRLVSHVSAESLVLALGGCGLGVLLTYAGTTAIRALGPDHLPRIDELTVDGTVLGFAVAVGALSALLSGLAPSLRLSRPDLTSALGNGARGGTTGRLQALTRSRLVVAQVAAAVVLLFGAGLLIRSFTTLLDQDLGFDPTDRVAVQVFAYDYENAGAQAAFIEDAVRNMEALPGVTGVALTTSLPASNDGVIANIDITVPLTIEGRAAPPEGQEPQVSVIQATSGYFDVIGTEIVAGRDFNEADNPEGTPVVIVNEALVRRHFGSEDPIGEQLMVRYGSNPVAREIVGVAADTRPLGHASEPRPEVYIPLSQMGSGSLTFVVRASSDGASLTIPVMEAIWEANPAQSVWGSIPVADLVSGWYAERRFSLFLMTVFSAIALALAAIGLYGIVSFSVERRQGELGIRRALGGRSGELVGMVLGEGARLAGAGLAIGLAASWYLSRFIQGMLFDVSPTDPVTFAALGAIVLLIALGATLVPAVRATRVDPVEALRSE